MIANFFTSVFTTIVPILWGCIRSFSLLVVMACINGSLNIVNKRL